MKIINRIYDAQIEYEEKYNEAPEILFVSILTYEEMHKEPQSLEGVSLTIAGCELIIVDNMLGDFKYLSHVDLTKAINAYNAKPKDLILIRKFEKSDKSAGTNLSTCRNNPRMIGVQFYIQRELIDAYQLHYLLKL
ncbi:hypothetical protein MMP66_00405 [Acinetobacter dispersus]|uniref:Uncharacterized protein n=1 Tax=Acinetobacter dispersus TaxID=70348 RepID=N9R9J6_9GAMM|nr:hypothetical protein [Acinetobacter dispersus]ENW93005.1 hypothetical protein F904_02948 [Acinetobacter dispersus]ENX54723.1 hypothetical protein F901_02038 [Acinetobacter dispersus]MCH7392736.1 hypothetical protein [Acinetobacter dispersus]